MASRDFKFSTQIQEKQAYEVFIKNHDKLITEQFYFQQRWLVNAYERFKDFDKYLILCYLLNKVFKAYNEHLKVYNFDEFYSYESFEIQKINIISLSKDLLISKETARRKLIELEKEGVLKKNKKNILINRKGQEVQKPTISITNLSRLISYFSEGLSYEKLLKGRIPNSDIEKKIKANFTQCWQYFFDWQLPLLIRWKKLFNDLESWVIWGNCVYNQNLVMNKTFKENLAPETLNDTFIDRLNNFGTQGLNAMTISELTGIPRPTVLRKLNILVKKKFLIKDEKNLYLIFGGSKTSSKKSEYEKIYKEVDLIRKDNSINLVHMMTKLLNVVIL